MSRKLKVNEQSWGRGEDFGVSAQSNAGEEVFFLGLNFVYLTYINEREILNKKIRPLRELQLGSVNW